MMIDSLRDLNLAPRARHLALALTLFVLAAPIAPGAPVSAAPPPPQSLGLAISATTGIFAEGDIAAFGVMESQQGKDLNGDGDVMDQVLHLYRASSGRVENTKHVLVPEVHGSVCRTGDKLAFVASENGNADFNGDGDKTDHLLHVLDLANGLLQRYHRSAFGGVACGGGHVAFRVSEPAEARDYNGDGDTSDRVWHLYDTAVGHGSNLELAEFVALHGAVRMGGTAMLYSVNEPDNDRDLNRDGDTFDRVFLHYDFATNQETNYELAGYLPEYERLLDTKAQGRFVPVRVPEAAQGGGLDINGDGDAVDTVVHAVDMATGNLIVGAAGYALPSASVWLTLFVDEAAEGATDFNGDGDAADHILVFQRATTGARFNTQRAVRGTPSGSPHLSSDFGAGFSGRKVAAEISEWDSQLDLDGDGQMNAMIVQVFDPRYQTIRNTGARSQSIYDPEEVLTTGRAHALTCVWESQVGSDLNGDGDQADKIAGAVPLNGTGHRLTNVAMDRTDPMRERGGTGYFLGRESEQGGDLNGDGDQLDRVLHQFDLGSGATRNEGITVETTGVQDRTVWATNDDALYFGADERSDGRDYNGDGDTGDIVIHRLP